MAYYNPKLYSFFAKLNQIIAIWIFLIPFYYIVCRLKIIGAENIPKDHKPVVVMSNHLSNLDPPLVSSALKLFIAYMAKEELYSVPVIGFLIKILGAFSVNREKVEKTTIKAAKELIESGWCVGIFLEGTRSKTPGVLGNPNTGAPYIANLTGIPILPVGIIGSNKTFGPITVKVGKPFYPDKDLEAARWQCAEKLSKLTGFKMPKNGASLRGGTECADEAI